MPEKFPALWKKVCALPIGFRLYVTIWIVIGIALTIKSLIKPGSHSVFPVYLNASWNWWNDIPLYDRHPKLDYFRYTPVAALFFFPFVLFGMGVGSAIWGWLSLGVFAFAGYRLYKAFCPGDTRQWLLFLFGMVALMGALSGIWNHQSNALIGALLVLGMLDIKDRNWNRSAVYFTFAVLLKPTVLPPIALVGVLHPWRLGWRLSLGLLAGLLFPFLTRPPEIVMMQYREWFDHIRDTNGERWPGFRDAWYAWLVVQEQIQGDALWPFFWDVVPDLVYRAIQVASGLICLPAVILWRIRGLEREQLILRSMALGMTWLMLFGPATEFPTFGLFSLFMAWAALEASQNKTRSLMVASLILILLFGWRAFVMNLGESFPLVLAAIPTGVLLFGIWLFDDTTKGINQKKSLSNREPDVVPSGPGNPEMMGPSGLAA